MYFNIALKILVGASTAFIIIRIIGKKAISDLTPFDLLYILVLSGLFEETIFDDDIGVFVIIFAMLVWAIIVYLVELFLVKSDYMSRLIQGKVSILISEGKLNIEELKKNRVDMDQLRTMLRQQNCYAIKDAYYAILETNGGVTVINKSEMIEPSVLLIKEGKIHNDALSSINKDEKWLFKELEKRGYDNNIDNIIYCEWLPDELFIYTEDKNPKGDKELD